MTVAPVTRRGNAWPPRQWGLVLCALALQVAVVYGPLGTLGEGRRWLVLGSYALLFPPLLANWRLWGIRVMAVGVVMNFLAMLLNGGWMPVTPEAVQKAGLDYLLQASGAGEVIPHTKDVLTPRQFVHLYPLTDVIVLRFPSPKVYSPGDLILFLGLATAALHAFWLAISSRPAFRRTPVTGTDSGL